MGGGRVGGGHEGGGGAATYPIEYFADFMQESYISIIKALHVALLTRRCLRQHHVLHKITMQCAGYKGLEVPSLLF